VSSILYRSRPGVRDDQNLGGHSDVTGGALVAI
jgi:hypothetical protein